MVPGIFIGLLEIPDCGLRYLFHPVEFVSTFVELQPNSAHDPQVLSQIRDRLKGLFVIRDLSIDIETGARRGNSGCLPQGKTVFVEKLMGLSQIIRILEIGRIQPDLFIEQAMSAQVAKFVLPLLRQIIRFQDTSRSSQRIGHWKKGADQCEDDGSDEQF